jgi:outer membrane murein-binding lipoprotein Lpp
MSSGQGEGTPCTLTYRQGTGYIEECPSVNTREVFTGELNDYLNSMKSKVQELESEIAQLVQKPKLSADDKRRLVMLTDSISTTVKSNLEYLKICFQEEIDYTLNAAKIELENFSNSLREQKQITGD